MPTSCRISSARPVLAVLAWIERQWGFLLLEAVWALVTAASIGARLTGRWALPTN